MQEEETREQETGTRFQSEAGLRELSVDSTAAKFYGFEIAQIAIVISLATLVITLGKILYDVLYGLRPRCTVVLRVEHDKDKRVVLRGLVANTGFRPFSIYKVAFGGWIGNRRSPTPDGLAQEVTASQSMLVPGQYAELNVDDTSAWWFARRLEVSVLPRPWRRLYIPLPHVNAKAKRWQRYVVSELKRALSDMPVDAPGILVRVGVGDDNDRVSFIPLLLIATGEKFIGGTSDKAKAIARTLPSRLPHLFVRSDMADYGVCEWNPEVVRKLMRGHRPWPTLFDRVRSHLRLSRKN